MAYTIKCSNCKRNLYTTEFIKFPLDYGNFRPIPPADSPYEEPVCVFCEQLFQVVPHDISMMKIRMMPLLTDKGVVGPKEKKAKESEPPPEPEYDGPTCECGCGQPVNKEGGFVSRAHKAKFLIGVK